MPSLYGNRDQTPRPVGKHPTKSCITSFNDDDDDNFETGTHTVAQVALKLAAISLPQPSNSWNYRHKAQLV